MTGTRNDVEELRQRVEEVEYLWDEEEKHCLTEVPKDPHHSKRHTSKIAEGVTYKHAGWIPATHRQKKWGWGIVLVLKIKCSKVWHSQSYCKILNLVPELFVGEIISV